MDDCTCKAKSSSSSSSGTKIDSNSNSSPIKKTVKTFIFFFIYFFTDLVYAVILSKYNSNSHLVFGDNLEHIEID